MYVQLYQRYYDTFLNHLISQTISTLLQRIETRGIYLVFAVRIFIFTRIPNASVIKVLTLSIIFPYLYPLSHFLPALSPVTLAKQPLTPNTRG